LKDWRIAGAKVDLFNVSIRKSLNLTIRQSRFMLRFYEGSLFGSKGLSQVQDHQASGSGASDLREPQAQATAGLAEIADCRLPIEQQGSLLMPLFN
jgi:hypothetical protein